MARNRKSNKSEETENIRKGGKPRNGRRGRKPQENSAIEKETKPTNDPAWYAANAAILRDAASYPFSYNTGATEIHDASLWGATPFAEQPAAHIPGICSLHVYPTVGTAIEATDPINVASQSVYSFVRHANSGHSNYDAPDLMLYIMAMANMYSFLVWCQRLYGYALSYDQRNRYIPNELIRTNNVDASDLINNLANFRFWINTLIAKMTSFAVPATMSIFSRMSFIYSDYYIEGTSIKEQIYQFVPEGFYKFGIDSDSLGNLTWEAFDYSTPLKVSDIITYGDALFNAIWSQEDFGIMSGDILKAYGQSIIKLVSIPEYYNIVPKFDPMVLTQIKNADIVRLTPGRIAQSATAGIILQTLIPKGYTTSDKYYGTAVALSAGQAGFINNFMTASLKDYRILTVDSDDPTPEIVMEATRLKVGYDAFKGWFKAGTEVITKVVITTQPGTDIEAPGILFGAMNHVAADWASGMAILKLEQALRNFHYMPRIWVAINNVGESTNPIYALQLFDIDNFTLLNYDDVRKLHEAATINMLAVPSIGKVQ